MGNILDYLLEVTPSFAARPFGPVDSLILSQLSYLDYGELVPGPGEAPVPFRALAGEAAIAALTRHDRVPELDGELVRRVDDSPRFADMKVGNYVNIVDKEKEQQFSAVSFFLNGELYAAYRGTDSSHIAWKEDFNLAFLDPVPSQTAGAAYLDRISADFSGPLRVGGHSKGGNIAVYSSLFCKPETRARIAAAYSHDGPGFSQKVLESHNFAEMEPRLQKTIPHSSLVGMLLQNQENYRVIRSSQFWLMQHDPYSWLVESGDFLYEEGLSAGASLLDKNLNAWIASLSPEELSKFADALYQVLCALPGDAFTDTPDKWWMAAAETLNGLKDLDQETYGVILHTVGSLLKLSVKSIPRPEFPGKLPDIQNLLEHITKDKGAAQK